MLRLNPAARSACPPKSLPQPYRPHQPTACPPPQAKTVTFLSGHYLSHFSKHGIIRANTANGVGKPQRIWHKMGRRGQSGTSCVPPSPASLLCCLLYPLPSCTPSCVLPACMGGEAARAWSPPTIRASGVVRAKRVASWSWPVEAIPNHNKVRTCESLIFDEVHAKNAVRFATLNTNLGDLDLPSAPLNHHSTHNEA